MKYGTQMESYHQVWTWIPTRGRLTLRMWRFKRQPLLLYSWVVLKAHHHQHLSMETFYSSYSSQLLFYFLSCSLPTGLIWHVALLPSSCPTESSLSSFSSYIQGNPLFYLSSCPIPGTAVLVLTTVPVLGGWDVEQALLDGVSLVSLDDKDNIMVTKPFSSWRWLLSFFFFGTWGPLIEDVCNFKEWCR